MMNLSSFHLFPWLPFDLRWEIWRLAWVSPPSHPSVCAPTCAKSLIVLESGTPALLAVNREAQGIARQYLSTVIRPYSPLADIIYIPRLDTWRKRPVRAPPEWEKSVRHIAIHSPASEAEIELLAGLLESLSSLKSISVIYSSETDTDPKAFTPSYWRGAGLELLDTLENKQGGTTDRGYMDKIRHFYYYMPEKATPGPNQRDATGIPTGPAPVYRPPPETPLPQSQAIDRRIAAGSEWLFYCNHLMQDELRRFEDEFKTRKYKSIKDHLANLEFELNSEVMLRREPIACWDRVRGGLRVRFQARCFSW
ncbi:hypothetical protein QBC34DRAFT_382478 [Podospora aff. communis PSN243]|uniref:2EXR domain-containing protein n=1 Tax=Podospora aff. communis PSN243 TaxID=3040156 RepID=A0AAV9GGD7_9PEZI|nr:hypothetical protein QBC34DRAFT_382478 [Podospora aff. communis PSN243]